MLNERPHTNLLLREGPISFLHQRDLWPGDCERSTQPQRDSLTGGKQGEQGDTITNPSDLTQTLHPFREEESCERPGNRCPPTAAQ